MTPDKLNEMASNMESLAASDYDLYIRERDELLDAVARYLRDCAEAEPVATVRVHDTGGNAGIAWSGVPTENAGVMRGGTSLYTHPQPKQADAVEELAALARFGAACLIASREELCDLDAGWLQAVAEATGCLKPETQDEPCADYCRCADEADSFPTQCLRVPDRLWRLAVALDSGKETTR